MRERKREREKYKNENFHLLFSSILLNYKNINHIIITILIKNQKKKTLISSFVIRSSNYFVVVH
jgi:hypothetical protein